jgi:hypothetical protein
MVLALRWAVREHEDGSAPLAAVDAVVAVELLYGHVIPTTTAEDGTSAPQQVFGYGARLDLDVTRILACVAPLRDDPVHRIVWSGDETVHGHRHMPGGR